MPTQSLNREQIKPASAALPRCRQPMPPAADRAEHARGLDHRRHRTGSAGRRIAGRWSKGASSLRIWRRALIDWEAVMQAKGSQDLLGPLDQARNRDDPGRAQPEEAGRFGTTNGAAMRITPVGLPDVPTQRFVAAVVQACQVTHNTNLGISSAAAVAAVVSAGINGMPVWARPLNLGQQIAQQAERTGTGSPADASLRGSAGRAAQCRVQQ
jgi:hypothetical protein